MRELKIFSGAANLALAADICGFLHLPLGQITLSTFPDGEKHCKMSSWCNPPAHRSMTT